MAYCKGCIEKDLKIEELQETVRAKAKLRYRETKGGRGVLRPFHPFFTDAFQRECPRRGDRQERGRESPATQATGEPGYARRLPIKSSTETQARSVPTAALRLLTEKEKKSDGDRECAFKAGEAPLSPPPQGVPGLPERVQSQAPRCFRRVSTGTRSPRR